MDNHHNQSTIETKLEKLKIYFQQLNIPHSLDFASFINLTLFVIGFIVVEIKNNSSFFLRRYKPITLISKSKSEKEDFASKTNRQKFLFKIFFNRIIHKNASLYPFGCNEEKTPDCLH